jgi:hypothetical protein
VSSRFAGWTALVVALWLMTPIAAAGQTPPPAQPPGAPGPPMPVRPPAEILEPGELRVFLDCQWECDFDYLRREITFVDHVRDSQSADIHVLVTTETTGGGGMRWKLQFIGLGRFQGHDEAVTFVTAQTDSPDMRRRALARWLRLGLATHAAKVHGRPDLDIAHPAHDETATPGATPPVTDPWDNWVINLNLSGNLSGEALSKSNSQRVNVSASRVTDAWRISVGGSWNRNTNTFQVSETSTVRSFTSSWSSNTLVVKSLGPKWSAAARSALSGSTFSNYDLTARAMMGLEYDIFPYAESTRRSLTFMYMVGAAHYDFEAETIFDRLDETHPEHALGASLGLSRFRAVGDLHAPDGAAGDPQDERGQEQQPEHRAGTRGGSGGRRQQPDQRRRVSVHRRRDGTQRLQVVQDAHLLQACGRMPFTPSQASSTAAGMMGLRTYSPTARKTLP